jgi:hypothetical protein
MNRLYARKPWAVWILYLSVLLCVFEGAIRKWVLRDSESFWRFAPYFAKDLALIALLLFCKPAVTAQRLDKFRRILFAGLFLILVGAAISSIININFVGAILSFRSLIFLPAFAYLAIPRLQNLKLERLAVLLGVLTLANAALGTLQYSSLVDAPLNFYANEKANAAVAYDENVRAMGTFSYITGFGNLAAVGAWAGLILLGRANSSRFHLVGWISYLAALWCSLLAISRATVILVVLIFLLWLITGEHPLKNVIYGLSAIVILAWIVYAINVDPVIEKVTQTVLERHETAGDTIEDRTIDPIIEISTAAQLAPLGQGFGTEQIGGVFADYGVTSFRTFENQFPRIVLEAGVLGLLGFFVTCIGTIYFLFITRRTVSDPDMRRTIVLTMFLLGSLFYINVAFNHVASFFAWVIIAAVLAVARPLRSDDKVALAITRPVPAAALSN